MSDQGWASLADLRAQSADDQLNADSMQSLQVDDKQDSYSPYTALEQVDSTKIHLAEYGIGIKQIPYGSKFIEVVVGSEEKVFYIHKELMKGKFFERLFKNDGWTENQNQMIKLPEEDPAIFKAICDYWYFGTVGLIAVGYGHQVKELDDKQLRKIEEMEDDNESGPAEDVVFEAEANKDSAHSALIKDRCTVAFLVLVYIAADYYGIEGCWNSVMNTLVKQFSYPGTVCYDTYVLAHETFPVDEQSAAKARVDNIELYSRGLTKWLTEWLVRSIQEKGIETIMKFERPGVKEILMRKSDDHAGKLMYLALATKKTEALVKPRSPGYYHDHDNMDQKVYEDDLQWGNGPACGHHAGNACLDFPVEQGTKVGPCYFNFVKLSDIIQGTMGRHRRHPDFDD